VLLNQGDVSTRILETIVKEPIDLVVMGTHGRKGFNRLLLGSVTEGVVHQAACPVLAVSRPQKEMTMETPGKLQLRTILLATDFSPHSDIAAAYAMKWASEWGARVITVHVVEEAPLSMRGKVHLLPEHNLRFDRQIAVARKRIEHLILEKAALDSEVSFDVRHGTPKEEVLRVAWEADADLIVTGARGVSGSAAPWGSVSSAVVRDGRFPVLVARERSL
jgi:nucleotide-binding universal stress UspA family protein